MKYEHLSSEPVAWTTAVDDDVLVDFDADGHVVGVEYLDDLPVPPVR